MISHRKTDHLISSFKDLRSGDYLYLDIDNTLLLTAFDRYGSKVALTELELASEIERLQASGVEIYGLTARDGSHAGQTIEQLASVGIRLKSVIHAPKIDGKLQKGKALRHHLTTLPLLPRRIVVMDDMKAQLENIAAGLSVNNPPVCLYQYKRLKTLQLNKTRRIPLRLKGYEVEKSLDGGTRSTYLLSHPINKSRLVLKYGAHPDALKMEILCNALYSVLGVCVPEREAFNTLPIKLAKKLNLKNAYGMFQVSQYIVSHKEKKLNLSAILPIESLQARNSVSYLARKDFVAHALLGNIDVAKEDNFILGKNGRAYLIDAGANFIYRAKGENRRESPSLLSELDTLRDAAKNKTGNAWFKQLKKSEIKNQIIAILKKIPELESVIWQVSQKIQLPHELRDQVLTAMGDRIDVLVHRYGITEQLGAKRDKKAREEETAAGVLTYTKLDGQWQVLLSKRVRHDWWDNFGGKSDESDLLLVNTAKREVSEESNGVLNYSCQDLQDSPFHDLVKETPKGSFVYRMYVAEHAPIELKNLTDSEHTEHQWVPLASLLSAVNNNKQVKMEGKNTCKVRLASGKSIILYPPLYRMLKQPPMLNNLTQLEKTGKLKLIHTRGYHNQAPLTGIMRVFVTPGAKRDAIVKVTMNHGEVLKQLKAASHPESSLLPSQERTIHSPLSQSELHLKTVLGDLYQADNTRFNVTKMLTKHFSHEIPNLSAEMERLITGLVDFIEIEKRDRDEHLYFYHACDATIAYAYEIYTQLYQSLKASNAWPVFRAQGHHFKKFATITEFIAHYSNQGRKEIDNNDENYNDCAISANVFLFGNHLMDTSCSIHYLLKNNVRRPVDLTCLLQDLLAPFNVSQELILALKALYDVTAHKQQGALYQIAIKRDAADKLVYPAGFLGKLNPYNGNLHLTAIIDAMRMEAGEEITNVKKLYISELQARILAHPQYEFHVQAFRMSDFREKERKAYDYELKKLIKEILYTLLQELGPGNRDHLHSGLTLFKTMTSLSHINGLPAREGDTLAGLTRAILGNDDAMVIRLLTRHPEWKTSQLEKRSYFHQNLIVKTHPVIEFILHYSKLKPETILLCFDEQWWKAGIIINEYHNILWWISVIPLSLRLAFAQWHKDKIKNYMISRVVHELPEQNRLAFALEMQNESGPLFLSVLLELPKQDRLTYAMEIRSKIQDEYGLINVLQALPKENRFVLASKKRDLIKSRFVNVVHELIKQDRLKFAMENTDKITTAVELAAVLWVLFEQDRLAFALHNQHIIKNGEGLVKVLSQLPAQDRLAFAIKNQDKIQNRKEYFRVLGQLPENDRSEFMKNQKWIPYNQGIKMGSSIRHSIGKAYLVIKQINELDNELPYLLYSEVNGKEIVSSMMAMSQLGFDKVLEAMKNNSLSLINTLYSMGNTASVSAKLLRHEFDNEEMVKSWHPLAY